MKSNQYKLSDDFINQIFLASEGFFSPEQLDKIIYCFNAEAAKYYFTPSAEANLIRIINSNYDKISFLRDCLAYPHHAEIITAIAANSAYLTDIAVRNPEYLYQVFGQDYLSSEIEDAKLEEEISSGLGRYKSFNAKLNFLRLFKRRVLLKIGLNDILGTSSLSVTTLNLSILARNINALLFQLSYEEILQKYNIASLPNKYVLASLGKLGGCELNYSSDVDLILFFDKNNFIETADKEYFELLSEAALLFIKSSTEMTGKGYLYRVDFRLRPDGRNSPLCRTIGDYLRYYELKGEDWERQMLIKLDFTGGDKELYKQFYDYLVSFIYPYSFSQNILRQIKMMKTRIEENSDGKRNVKLFPGGIRDIEFSVQALQLLNGGRHKILRTGNSLNAIKFLTQLKLLTFDESENLKSAYVLYRKIEHYMQLMNDNQTHQLPEDVEELNKLAFYLGYSGANELEKALTEYRIAVRKIFNSITAADETGTFAGKNDFENIKFINKNLAERNIKFLRSGTGLLNSKQFDSRTIRLYGEMEPELIAFLSESPFPDLVLDNFAKFINSLKIVSIWYKEFSKKNLLEEFLKLCQNSDRFIRQITFNSRLNEFYLSGLVFQKNLEYENFSISQVHFILTVQFTLGLISHVEFSTIKQAYIKKIISKKLDDYFADDDFFAAALGSFGSDEMHFGSDVDLIIVNSEEKYSEAIQKKCRNFLTEINKILSPVKVDLRLRPEGVGSLLVWNIEKYKEYLLNRARVWEFQALTKMKFVSGNKLLFNEFESSVLGALKNLNKDKLKTEMLEVYKKILSEGSSLIKEKFDLKKSRGSLLDIQYSIQFLLLSNSGASKVLSGKNSSEILKGLKPKINEQAVSKLISNYKFYKTVELSIQTVFDTNSSLMPIDEQKRKRLAYFLKIESQETLRKKIEEISIYNHKIFMEIAGR